MNAVPRPVPAGPRPPADGFARALAGGRRRRLRTLARGAACGAAMLTTFTVAALPRLAAGGVNGLQPTNGSLPTTATTQPYSPETVAPQATPPPDAPRGDAPYGTPAPVLVSAQPAASPVAAPPVDPALPPVSRAASPDPGVSEQPDPARREPVDLTFEDQPVTAPCEGSKWCFSADVTGNPGDAARTLRVHACRAAADTTGVLRFVTANEVDLRVLHDGTDVWDQSDGTDEPDSHDVAVDRWQCAVWSTVWHRVDNEGGAAAAGTYQLRAEVRSWPSPSGPYVATFDIA